MSNDLQQKDLKVVVLSQLFSFETTIIIHCSQNDIDSFKKELDSIKSKDSNFGVTSYYQNTLCKGAITFTIDDRTFHIALEAQVSNYTVKPISGDNKDIRKEIITQKNIKRNNL